MLSESEVRLLEQLAEKLGTTVEYLWPVMVQQARVAAISHIIQLLFVVAYAVAIYLVYRHWSKDGHDIGFGRGQDEDRAFALAIATVPLWIVVPIAILSLGDLVTKLFNPEFWALMQIVNALGGG